MAKRFIIILPRNTAAMSKKTNDLGKYIDEYLPPIQTTRRCKHCEYKLGAQNPNDICGSCIDVSIKLNNYK